MNRAYIDAVRLLLAVAPAIFRQPGFALKGGTAINLFLRDMPRLSVDLDLVFAEHRPDRDDALRMISSQLESIRSDLNRSGMTCSSAVGSGGDEVKLFVERDRTRIKVEVNHVFRGTVLPVEPRALTAMAQDMFFTDIEIPILHPDELYGSKLVAAMDRQHPRDIFDVLELYEGGGLTAGIVECFVCYLAGHNRPVHEVLFANEINIAPAYTNEFEGMTRQPVPLERLQAVRRQLFTELPSRLSDKQRSFLTGLVEAKPDWSLMSCAHLAEMPAVRWKLANLERLSRANPAKFAQQSGELRERFGG
ncbi:MAG: nucleotidyl transferase AbiEii/AbiGii toxin family protein [Verrucomicrobiales bacterium]|nr:nucleotidyl transferase AbiEii/AbiGii toxin family protein [Verrucomicrobiales bacterium]